MEYLPITIKCKVNLDGNLIPNSPEDSTRKDIFKNSLEVGTVVEVTYQVYNPDYSVAQLDKIHKLIRILASDTGDTFEDMKLHVKNKAGLGTKSFSDCTKEEINSTIHTALSIGDLIGCNLHSY